MINIDGQPIEFDFFMDEDVRSKRIGILVMEKRLSPALTQAMFRIKQNANIYHMNRIESNRDLTMEDKKNEAKFLNNQMREIKWSSLNLIRSFIAGEFLRHFFQYWAKGPLPIMFFNAPFVKDHKTSINNFFDELHNINLDILASLKNTGSIFFLDSFNTPARYRFEQDIMIRNNLSRCYRLDSRAHDLLQLTDLLLGVTVFEIKKKHTSNKAKLRLFRKFKSDKEYFCAKRKDQHWSPIYIF